MNKTVVETLCYYSKFTSKAFWLRDQAKEEIQALLDKYSEDGYELVSTDAHGFGFATYVYLYFKESAA